MTMTKQRAWAAVLGVAILSSVVLTSASASAGVTTSIKIRGFGYQPNATVVAPGETIVVVNIDGRKQGIPHSLTSKDGLFDTGVFVLGHREFTAPTEPGLYRYSCVVHPFMRGEFTVSG